MWRNERLDILTVISLICCNAIPEHHKSFFRLVLTAHLGKETFFILDTGIPSVCLPGSTCNLMGFFWDYNKVLARLCSTLCELSCRRLCSCDMPKCKQKRQTPEGKNSDVDSASNTNSISDLVSSFTVVMSSMLRKQTVKNLSFLLKVDSTCFPAPTSVVLCHFSEKWL